MRTEIDALLHVMQQAFDGGREHSLMANLEAVREGDWQALLPGGSRSIYEIVLHVADCKWMYDNHAFGDASYRWDAPPIAIDPAGGRDAPELIRWLTLGQEQLMGSVRALPSDAELDRPRRLNWGGTRATRGILLTMIEHDLYHAGEVNHLRSLLQGEDRWAYAIEHASD